MTRANDKILRPRFVEDKHLRYLDTLRGSGATNMFGAASYLSEMFPNLTRLQARKILLYWMETFGQDSR